MTRRLTVCAGCLCLAFLLLAQTPMMVPPDVQNKRLVHQVPPVYPKLAWQARVQGTVRLAALIDETGSVSQLKVISGHPLLVGAAMEAAKQWRYLPATRNGFAVPVRTTIEIPFTIRRERPTSASRTLWVLLQRRSSSSIARHAIS